ncbi:MAG: ABC transporter substrate-binding protein [Nostoc sp. ChiSLP02]|nr:ABC transporter substrate-binding protein [Nostoc sp. DedSLP05]MDZ8103731.1 ABC transporter substrate-binding protein [Nostoc sp. DedSLP01]MDZ8184306.1 ABC transporter substrate-binding protein [Nostoc sp. ChiSLP02]
MYRRWLLSALALFLSIILIACNTVSTQNLPTNATNNSETANINSQQLPKRSIKRVVALSSLSADIIAQLDQTKIVGITGSKLFNDDPRFKNIPRVSEGQNPPNLEKIVALKPDLVIGAEGFSTIPIQKIKQLGIQTLLTQVKSWESLEELTKTLARFIDADPQPLLNLYKTFLPDKPAQSLTALVLVSRQPILAPNKNSWAGDILRKFQVKNLAAELQEKSPVGGYVTLSAEKVLEANPEAIILVNTPRGNSEVGLLDSLKKEAFWNKLQATQKNRVYVFDYYGLVNPGSIDAIEKACQQIKKDLFGGERG